MCGIAGLIQFDDRPLDCLLLETMTRSLAHRGPDGEGYVLLAGGREKPFAVRGRLSETVPSGRTTPGPYRIGFGHRRLAIFDLTALGHQPMGTDDDRYWITYNGAVYNAPELRQELRALGYEFRSSTDTEVVLASYRHWGRACLPRLNGMFAFAVWDPVEEAVFCARDRFGIKPFYYRDDGGRFVFASEIKALLHDRAYRPAPDSAAVYAYLTQSWQDHTTETFFSGIHQLAPGECALVRIRESARRHRIVRERWWRPEAEVQAVSLTQAVGTLRDLLEDSVRLQMRADVPIGSCLSGGLDSSTIACLMTRLSDRRQGAHETMGPVATFSSCPEGGPDERPFIRQIVDHAGVRNELVTPVGERLADCLPTILWHQEEPFAGTSVMAQWDVMRVAGQAGVKVLLDGQGADELFVGYPRYVGFRLADLTRAGRWLSAIREWRSWNKMHGRLPETAVAGLVRGLLPGSLAQHLRGRVTGQTVWLDPAFARAHRGDPGAPGRLSLGMQRLRSLTHDLPALLHYEDRNAMAFSIEARVPYLDHRLVEWVLRLPPEWQLQGGLTKALLREAARDLLPESVRLRRDKVGFATPEDYWLRHALRRQIEETLASDSMRARPYWRAPVLRALYHKYCEGGLQIGPTVWRWVNLEWWHRRFCD